MLRATTLVSVLIALPGAAFAQTATPEAKPDTVQVHGKALPLSCPEWSRNGDGSWTNVGPLLVGEETVKAVTLRGANAAGREAAAAYAAAWACAACRRNVADAPWDERSLLSSCIAAAPGLRSGGDPDIHVATTLLAARFHIMQLLSLSFV